DRTKRSFTGRFRQRQRAKKLWRSARFPEQFFLALPRSLGTAAQVFFGAVSRACVLRAWDCRKAYREQRPKPCDAIRTGKIDLATGICSVEHNAFPAASRCAREPYQGHSLKWKPLSKRCVLSTTH